MKTFRYLFVLGLMCAAPAFAGNDGPEPCSARMLAGRWMFATDVGHQSRYPGGDITAIGTFRVDRQGNVFDGVFDATVSRLALSAGRDVHGNHDHQRKLHRHAVFRDQRWHRTQRQPDRAGPRSYPRHVTGHRASCGPTTCGACDVIGRRAAARRAGAQGRAAKRPWARNSPTCRATSRDMSMPM